MTPNHAHPQPHARRPSRPRRVLLALYDAPDRAREDWLATAIAGTVLLCLAAAGSVR